MSDISQRMAGLSSEKQQLLLQRLREQQEARSSTDLSLPQVVSRPEERYLPFPLTDVQQTYWAGRSGCFDLGACGSNVYTELEMTGVSELTLPQLNRAMQRLIERHDMLRALVLPDGQQRILPHVPAYAIRVRDLRGQDAQAVETEVARVRDRMCREKGAIDRWPLFDVLAHLLDGQRLRLHARIDALLIDGRSRLIFFQEFQHLVDDPEAPLPPLECSYRDYALTWRAFQESELYQRSRGYWMRRLSTLPPAPELPVIRPVGPTTRSLFVTRNVTVVNAHDWLRLKNHAARSGLTPSLLVTAAFAEVVGAWSTSAPFTLSLVGSYRPPIHPRIDHILGNFNVIYLLEVRSMAGSFEERAKMLQKQLLLDLEHRYCSGFQVLREFKRLQGGSSRTAVPLLFNSVLEYSHTSYQHRQNPDDESRAPRSSQRMEELDSSLNIPQVLLSLTIGESDEGGLRCKSQAVEAVFPQGLIPDLLDAYARLLQTLANEEASWHNVERELLPAAQAQQRAAFNATEGPVPTELLHTLCAAQVPRRPHQVAVVSPNRTLTYQEVYRAANRVGRWLRRAGAGPGTLVAVVSEKGWEQIVAVLGVLQSGAAYLPVDASISREQLWSLFAQGAVRLVLTQSWLDESLEWPVTVERLCIDHEDQLGEMDEHVLTPVQTSEDLAYVMYDRDAIMREVRITHGGALNTILALNRRFPIGARDRVLALAPLHSDLSVYDIFGTLIAGGTLITSGALSELRPAPLATLLVQEQITVLNSTPAVLELLVDYASDHPEISLAALRRVLLSRDWIPVTLPGRLQALAKHVQVVSLGGASEASIWSTSYPVTAVDPCWQSIPYGQPLTNQRVYVLTEECKPCPLWVPGEIYIGGRGLAREGERGAEHARTRFIHHPGTGERLLRTGDVGRFLPGGYIELLGRKEAVQVRAHGYPVERRQIEAVLERHPALRGAIVLEQEHGPGHPSLVAYLLTHQKEDLAALDIHHYLQRHVPEYMIPDAFVMVTAFPLTSQGEVDRGAFPRPAERRTQTTHAPRDAVERRIAELWQEILGCRTPGINENFFELGGNSLLAVRLIQHMHSLFKQRFPLAPFFQGKATIAQLATLLRQSAHCGEDP